MSVSWIRVVPFFLLAVAAPAVADTVALAIHSHCSPGTFCNATKSDGTPITSFAEYRLMVLDSVQEMNLQWKPTGISFLPLVLPIDSNPDWYFTEGCGNPPQCADLQTTCFSLEECAGIGDGGCTNRRVCPDLTTLCSLDSDCPAGQQRCLKVNDQRRQLWREQVAATSPSVLHMMLTEGPDVCCSHIPSYKPTSQPPCRRVCETGTSQGQPCFDFTDCAGTSSCVGADLDDATNVLGIFCDPSRGSFRNGSIWAHEMGHHFCLWHTFNFQDSAEVLSPPPDWDGDAVCDVLDTPEDPGVFETYNGNLGRDEALGGSILNDHEWCRTQTLQTAGFLPIVDPGSPHATPCLAICEQKAGGSIEPLFLEPFTEAAMSYYGARCTGPYIINGVEYPAFSSDSVDRIRDCRANQPARAGMPDACAALGGDTDLDGICDVHDNCRTNMNTAQRDGDGDGTGDVCDLCPALAQPTQDVDNDGLGDICDPDADGDGCLNEVDQHRLDATVTVGSFYNVFCAEGNRPQYAFEGADHDGDGRRDCEDPDDDNDGICDQGGPLPAGTAGTGPDGCVRGDAGRDLCPLVPGIGCLNMPSPGFCPPDWAICRGAACLEFNLTLRGVGDPDPEQVFERFDILDNVLYLLPVAGLNLSQSTVILQSLAPPNPCNPMSEVCSALPNKGAEGPLVLEIRRRDTGEVVRTVAEYEPADVNFGNFTLGTAIAVIPDASGGPTTLDVGTTFLTGVLPDVGILVDGDEDGWPDSFDNCVETANASQHDSDGDKFGNRCDADLNGDAETNDMDIALVADCDGVNLQLELPLAEPSDIGGDDTTTFPGPEELTRALACRAADLDEDFDVDPDDLQDAMALDGQQPGPSAFAIPDNACEGVDCDDGNACTLDSCHASSGLCVHVTPGCDDGDPCTDEFCDEATGECIAIEHSCDDGNPCTRAFCITNVGCAQFPINEGEACEDGDLCTFGGSCSSGACVPSSSVDCTDGSPCTVDACNPATGACEYAPFCDDGDLCSADSCDPDVGCTFTPVGPGEASGLRFRTGLVFEWDDDGNAFNAYRGTITAGGLSQRKEFGLIFDHLCWESRDSADDGNAMSIDSSVPEQATGFYYLVTRVDSCGEGHPGFAPDGTPRDAAVPCPAAP